MIRAVLFDIDGTLIDSNELHVEVWHLIFAEAGQGVDRSAIRGQIGRAATISCPPCSRTCPSARRQRSRADTARSSSRDISNAPARPFRGASDLLRRAHGDGRKVVLASSASEEELRHYIELLDVEDIVSAASTSDDVDTTKPAPDIFARALAKGGVPPGEAVAVGDTPYDVASAGGAAIGTVALLFGGFTEEALRAAGAKAVYADVAALLDDYAESPLVSHRHDRTTR